MEYTKDVINDAFETAGGSAIFTDGEYYWRGDCADYVEHYGVALPSDFIGQIRRHGGVPPAVAAQRLLEIDRYLMSHRDQISDQT